ncbi:amidohydrolase family protein [Nocardiopsis composta]|uniref:Putative TIM-barrel fold metal-dependent hydrolase n=1 Tax=Nocardiopsis composta TaxID=157465 RepID=A0A7W8VDP4_9ACTN|nr:amidohydrolase family protein [Nocardiopsis composta]MBB5432462.1 putative TIM-barrel fold metal-dependent hydrolase [Nocardiopsis composta]
MFDAHLHIIDPRFPLAGDQDYRPEPFTVEDYRARTAGLGVTGGAVVAASFQGYGQAHLLAALRELGPSFVGVAQLPADTSDSGLRDLHAAGVRALRFNLFRGMADDIDAQVQLGLRAADLLGWPAEFYLDSRRLPELAPVIAPLPRVSVDHLGLSAEGLPALLDLVGSGARVKATGFGRGDLDVARALRAIADVNPGALMFGTDLPSTRAPRPFRPSDIELLTEALGPEQAERALSRNALDFYGVPTPQSRPPGGLTPGKRWRSVTPGGPGGPPGSAARPGRPPVPAPSAPHRSPCAAI